MKPTTELIKKAGGHTVRFRIGNQGFTLYPSNGKEDAKFLKKMLEKAFEKLETETKKETT